DLAGTLLANHPGQIGGTEAGVYRADLGSGLAEDGVIGSNAQVADHMQHMTTADGKTIDPGDHRLGHLTDQGLQLLHRQPDDAATVVLSVMCALITAGAERLVPRSGQYDDADAPVPACAV